MGIAQARGVAGEQMAASYFELIGCPVVARNTRLAGVEVDLVVTDGETRVLVEVKTRGRGDFGGAALAVDARKRQRLLRAARTLTHDGVPVRIDVIALETSGDGASLRHYRGAVTDSG